MLRVKQKVYVLKINFNYREKNQTVTMALSDADVQKQIKHMIKHKYVPFSFGKKKYNTGAAKK